MSFKSHTKTMYAQCNINDPNWNGDEDWNNKGGELTMHCAVTIYPPTISTYPSEEEEVIVHDETYEVEGTVYSYKGLCFTFGKEETNRVINYCRNHLEDLD